MTEEKGRESSIRHSYSLRSATSINSSELTSCSNTSYGTPGVSSDCTSDRPVSCQTTDGAKAQDVEQTTVIESSESKSDTKEEVSAGAELRGKRRRKKFVGVRQRPSGRWVAEIKDTTQKIRLWLGTFDTAEEAAHAYDEAACLLRGTNTRTNFVPHPSAKGSALASKVAQMIHLRRHPDPTASAFTSRSSASVPQQLLVESRSSSCENDAHSSCLSPSPPAPTSTHNTVSRCEEWINEYEARRKTALRKRILEDGNSVSRIRADAVPVADISFCNESVSSPIDAAFRRGSRFERRHLEQQEEGGDQAKGMIGAEPMAKDMQLSYSGEKLMSDEGLRFRRGSFMEAVLGVSDDFMSSSDIALAPYAMDLAYFGFGTGTESIPMQIDGFPLINELSKQMAEAEESFAESSGHSEESKMSYSEDVKRMRFERRNSASLYAMNGVHEILKHSSTPVPFSISSLSSSMVPSFNPLLSPPPPPYLLSSSSPWMPTPTLESSWKTNQTLAAPPLPPAGVSTPSGPVASMPTTSENLDPQEAMWNSWDLAPLCPLSVA